MKQKRDFDWMLFLGMVLVGASILTAFLYTNWEISIGLVLSIVSLAIGIHLIATKYKFQFSKRFMGIYFLTLGLIELFLAVSTRAEELNGILLASTLIIGQTIFFIIYKYNKSIIPLNDSNETT